MTDGQLVVGLIHAVVPAMGPMREAVARELPTARVINVLDEGLLTEIERRGGLTSECVDRLSTQVRLAIDAGADAVLLTCNAYSPVVERVQAQFPYTPVLAVDQTMIDLAVERASCIGVLATVKAGLEQQSESLRRAARSLDKKIEIVPSLHPEAMAALQRGDGETHDRILLQALPALAHKVELVLLAQASMARLLDRIPAELESRVLASPRLAAQRLRQAVEKGL